MIFQSFLRTRNQKFGALIILGLVCGVILTTPVVTTGANSFLWNLGAVAANNMIVSAMEGDLDGFIKNFLVFSAATNTHLGVHDTQIDELYNYIDLINNHLVNLGSEVINLWAEIALINLGLDMINLDISNIYTTISVINNRLNYHDSQIINLWSSITLINTLINDINSHLDDVDSEIVDIWAAITLINSQLQGINFQINDIYSQLAQIYAILQALQDWSEELNPIRMTYDYIIYQKNDGTWVAEYGANNTVRFSDPNFSTVYNNITREGMRLFVDAIIVPLTGIMLLDNNTLIEGRGWDTVFVPSSTLPHNFIFKTDAWLSSDPVVENVTLKNFVIDASQMPIQGDYSVYAKSASISLAKAKNVVVENVYIKNSSVRGISVDYSENVKIRDVVIDGVRRRSTDGVGNGVSIYHSSYCDVTNSRFKNFVYTGIRISHSAYCKIEGNTIEGSTSTGQYGIHLRPTSDFNGFNIISKNYIYNIYWGIKSENYEKNDVISGNVIKNIFYGISIVSAHQNIIANNKIEQSFGGGTAIYLDGGWNNLVDGNVIGKIYGSIREINGDYNIISNNLCYQTTEYAITGPHSVKADNIFH